MDGADGDFSNAEPVFLTGQGCIPPGSWNSAVRQEDSGEARGRVYTTARGIAELIDAEQQKYAEQEDDIASTAARLTTLEAGA